MLKLIGLLIFLTLFGALTAARSWLRQADGGTDQAPTPAERDSFLDRWERLASQAGLPWKRTLYVAVAACSVLLAGLLSLLDMPLAALLVLLAGLVGPQAYVRRLQETRTDQFERQLPPALFLAASVLRAGGSLQQAVDAIAREMPAPLGPEFRLISRQMRLGVPAQQAFVQAQERVGLVEFAAVVVAVRISTEIGGNLAHICDQIAKSIMDGQNARRTLQAFTTEGRTSANIIAALPLVVMVVLQVLSPAYFEPLFGSTIGRVILAVCAVQILIGWHVVRRMVDIR